MVHYLPRRDPCQSESGNETSLTPLDVRQARTLGERFLTQAPAKHPEPTSRVAVSAFGEAAT